MTAFDVGDSERLAARKLPRFPLVYVDGGAFEEVTLEANLADLRRIRVRQPVHRDVSETSMDCR